MIEFIICLLFLNFATMTFGQYDFVAKALFPDIETVPVKEKIILNQVTEVANGQAVTFFELSNPLVDLFYYPKNKELECGYLMVNGESFQVKGNCPHNSWGCDLDESSFELAKLNLGKSSYVILTAINWGSGSSTRIVFCHLFDITDKERIQYFPLWSMYGSSHCFGDFNLDGKLDFLEIRYDPEAKNNDVYRLSLTSLHDDKFEHSANSYIVFKREYEEDGIPDIISLHEKW